jgi:regulator of protease activity HflC (stomatin/prohibitin superfamily)
MNSTSCGSRLVSSAARSPALADHRARGAAEADPHLARDDLRQRGLAEPRRAEEQHMVHRLAARARGLDEHPQVLARRLLADELAERLGAQGGVLVLGLALGGEGDGLGHFAVPRASAPVQRRRARPRLRRENGPETSSG